MKKSNILHPRSIRFSDEEVKLFDLLAKIGETNRTQLLRSMCIDYVRVLCCGRNLQEPLTKEVLRNEITTMIERGRTQN